MSRTRKALITSFISQYLTLGITFATTVIVSRLLDPEEIGVFSVAAAFVLIAHVLRDFGSGQYIIQEPELTDNRIRAAFSVTLLLGWGTGAVVYLISPLIGQFYNENGVTYTLQLLAANFFLLPFGSITMAYLQRNMDFFPSLIAKVSSATAQATVSITGAVLGYSYISLAWGSVAASATMVLVAAYFRPKELPILPGFAGSRRVFSFGSKMSVAALLGTLGNSAPDLIVGRMLGLAPVGLFSRAKGTVELFNSLVLNGIHPVLTPLFAEARRSGDSLKRSFLYATECVTAVAWTFYGCLAVLAPEFIVALFGEKWSQAGILVQILAVGKMIFITTSMYHQLFVASGMAGTIAKLYAFITPIGIVLIFLGALINIEMVAWLSILRDVAWLVILWPFLGKTLDISFFHFLVSLRKSALISGLTILMTILIKASVIQYITNQNLVLLASCFVGGTLSWLVAIVLSRHPLYYEMRNTLSR